MDFRFNPEDHSYFLDGEQLPSVTDICSLLSGRISVNDAVLQHAARRGTTVHELCELIDYDVFLEDIEVEPELAGYVLSYVRFLRDYKPEWKMVEQKLFSSGFGFAGTLDRYGTIDGKPTIVDIKTTEGASKATKIGWACQLAGYATLLGESEARLWILQLSKSGKYRIIQAEDVQSKYKFDAFALFHQLREIKQILM